MGLKISGELVSLPGLSIERMIALLHSQGRQPKLAREIEEVQKTSHIFHEANLVSWGDVLNIADSISKGLMHLHEELPATKGEKYKPAVAHRDFKSKNVLIKNDMSACIADFGLALIFYQGKPTGETHGQEKKKFCEQQTGLLDFMKPFTSK
ncbi:activin receptor type-2B [Trichonephila clavipes]|uniref:receptor protein serine/threonine kinase n=1 Tax=Trichonephila clavipes TaxID=2585209 RepID=A0A8X6SPK8_TRICX|nr:activin receptor type-2B [Trichonephila clavipes]